MARSFLTDLTDPSQRIARVDAMQNLFGRAQYSACLELIGDIPSDEEFVMQLRCLVSLGRFHEAASDEAHVRAENLTAPFRTQALCQLAYANDQIGRPAIADELFAQAYALAKDQHGKDDLYEIRYFDALRALSRTDFAKAELLLQTLSADKRWLNQAKAVQARIVGARGDLAAQLHLLEEVFDETPESDVALRATTLHLAAELATELHRPDVAEELVGAFESMEWPSDMESQRLSTLIAFAWGCMVSGNALGGYEFLARVVLSTHESSVFRFKALVGMAFFASACGETDTAARKLVLAYHCLQTVSWEEAGLDRLALMHLVAVAVQTENLPLAAEARDRYRAVREPSGGGAPLEIDEERQRAFECYAEGLFARALGDEHRAARFFLVALSIWKKLGYRWRAVQSAIELASLTNRPTYYEYAVSETDGYFPHAWFSGQLKAYRERTYHPELKKLTRTRQGVVLGILARKSDKEIAQEIGVSEVTVRRQVSQLLTLYNITPRKRRVLARVLQSRGFRQPSAPEET